jgi:hypothetical protein
MIRKSITEWKGDGPTGSGSLSTESGALWPARVSVGGNRLPREDEWTHVC